MEIKPIRLELTNSVKKKADEPLTAAEMGKLWATYMGNSMSVCVLKYFLEKVENQDIKLVLQNALNISEDIVKSISEIFKAEDFPIPVGFGEEDVHPAAPRLFVDDFYLYYLKYTGKIGMSHYSDSIPMMVRTDIRDYFISLMDAAVKLLSHVSNLIESKGILVKQPIIPTPVKVDFIKKKSYLNGVFGNVRPLQALEIAHLFSIIESNAASKALLIAFSQVARHDHVRQFFLRGKEIVVKHLDECVYQLHNDDMPSPLILDHLVTTSTIAPFSDKLMLFHKLDMFSMKIRLYGNAASLSPRRDLGGMYARFLMEVGLFVNDGAKIMIEEGWMEQPPESADRDSLASH